MVWKETLSNDYLPTLANVNIDPLMKETDDDSHQLLMSSTDWKKVKLVKRGVNKVKEEALKAGDLSYHGRWGYLKLEKQVFDGQKHQLMLNEWECSLISPGKASGSLSKMQISSKKLSFHIEVTFLMQ